MTLIELLAVIAVIAIMLGLLAPAIGSFASTAGRKAAVTKLMNTFEQARVAALESGANVAIILKRSEFPAPDAIMVVRDRLEWDTQPGTDDIQLTKWIDLPEKVLLFSKSPIVADGANPPSWLDFTPPGPNGQSGALSYIAYSPHGSITYPSPGGGQLTLFVTEGVRDASGTEARVSDDGIAPLERIAFARYTGRSRLDITTLTDDGSLLGSAD